MMDEESSMASDSTYNNDGVVDVDKQPGTSQTSAARHRSVLGRGSRTPSDSSMALSRQPSLDPREMINASTLGQGEFVKFDVVPNDERNLFSICHREHRSADGVRDDAWRLCERMRSKAQMAELLAGQEVLDEIDLVGVLDDVTLDELLSSNQVHFCCAAMSTGVVSCADGRGLLNVDNAVRDGYRQLCSVCNQYGATIVCKEDRCEQKYHYPCAVAAGAFLDVETMRFYCTHHTADKQQTCAKCNKVDDWSTMLFCTSCSEHYHGACVGHTEVTNIFRTRAGWQCQECKLCRQCGYPNDGTGNRLAECEQCHKSYHAYCVQPKLASIPKTGWKCKHCRKCGDCGSRSPGNGVSSRWHLKYTVCDSCYQQRNKGVNCAVCHKAYRHLKNGQSLVQCNNCGKQVHHACDASIATLGADALESYTCPPCVANPSARAKIVVDSAAASQASSTIGEEVEETKQDEDYVYKPPTKHSSKKSTPARRPTTVAKKSTPRGGAGRGKVGVFTSATNAKSKRTVADPSSLSSMGVSQSSRDDEEYIHTIVVANSDDAYFLAADVCVICGSIGDGDESCMVSCSQCAQCYHTYCANVHMSRVIGQRGWRCLDCTVCEGCGLGSDEPHLLLCELCDISYHTYCLNPPLQTIPTGAWKCKWCTRCVLCTQPVVESAECVGGEAHTVPLCAPCGSLRSCDVCKADYGDEQLIIQCTQCRQWTHAECDGLMSETEVDQACEQSYQCAKCRPNGSNVPMLTNPSTYSQDSVMLTRFGCEATHRAKIRAVSPPPPATVTTIARRRTDGPNGESTAGGAADDDASNAGDSLVGGDEGSETGDGRMKRKYTKTTRFSKLHKIGVGGFVVRPSRQRMVAMNPQAAIESGVAVEGEEFDEIDAPGDSVEFVDKNGQRKMKRKRRSRRAQLEENLPSVIQKQFFAGSVVDAPIDMDEQTEPTIPRSTNKHSHLTARSALLFKRVLQIEARVGGQHPPTSSQRAVNAPNAGASTHDTHEDPYLAGLMGTGDEIDFDLLTNLLSDNDEGDADVPIADLNDLIGTLPTGAHNDDPIPPPPQMDVDARPPMMQQQPQQVQVPQPQPQQQQPPQPYMEQPSAHHPYTQHYHPDAPFTPAAGSSTSGDRPNEMSREDRDKERWEQDEPLGDRATIAAVLHANIKAPELRQQFPVWLERLKHIQKIWRQLQVDERSVYVQRARDNRTFAKQQKVRTVPGVGENAAAYIADVVQAHQPQMQQQPPHQLQLPLAPQQGYYGMPPQQHHRPALQQRMPMTPQRMPPTVRAPTADWGAHGQMQQHMYRYGARPMPIDCQHQELMQRQHRLESQLQAMEKALADFKKLKKSLSIRQKAMKRNLEPMGRSLPEHEVHALETLVRNVATYSRDIDVVKKELKANSDHLLDYQAKYGFGMPPRHPPPHMYRPPPPPSMPQPIVAPRSSMDMRDTETMLSPTSSVSRPNFADLRSPQNSDDETGGAEAGVVELAVKKRRRKKRVGAAGEKEQETIVDGDGNEVIPEMSIGDTLQFHIPYATPVLCETIMQAMPVVQQECLLALDEIIDKVVVGHDGPMINRSGNLLKRFLRHNRRHIVDVLDLTPAALNRRVPATPIKNRKRRKPATTETTSTTTGAAPSSNPMVNVLHTPTSIMPPSAAVASSSAVLPAHEPSIFGAQHTQFLNRMMTALRDVEKSGAVEPVKTVDRTLIQPCGISSLPDKYGFFINDDKMGCARLKFLPDYYNDVYGKTPAKPPIANNLRPPHPSQTLVSHTVYAASIDFLQLALPLVAQGMKPCTDYPHKMPPPPNWALMRMRACQSPPETVFDDGMTGGPDCAADIYRHLNGAHEDSHNRRSPELLPQATIEPARRTFTDPTREEWANALEDTELVTFTLTEEGAANVQRVMDRLAALLNLSDPIVFDVQMNTPPHTPDKPHVAPPPSASEITCHLCDKVTPVTDDIITKTAAQLQLSPSEHDDTAHFCGVSCYFRFAVMHKIAISAQEAKLVVEPQVDAMTVLELHELHPELFTINAAPTSDEKRTATICDVIDAVAQNNDQPIEIDVKPSTSELRIARDTRQPTPVVIPPPPPPVVRTAQVYFVTMKEGNLHVRDVMGVKGGDGTDGAVDAKRWFGHRWDRMGPQIRRRFETLLHELSNDGRRRSGAQSGLPEDNRTCELCGDHGDASSTSSGRLLNSDAGKWVHVNCALWSSEVYETVSGALMNCEEAIDRAVASICHVCQRSGATLNCSRNSCTHNYHFPCAQRRDCVFMKDKTMLCVNHSVVYRQLAAASTTDAANTPITSMAVMRRVYIDRDENQLIAKLFKQGDALSLCLRVGSLTFMQIGQLLPHELRAHHNVSYVYPVGYTVVRVFWSPLSTERRRYTCTIGSVDARPSFTVSLCAVGGKTTDITESTATRAWEPFLSSIERQRHGTANQLKLFASQLTGEAMFGFDEPAISKMIESLPGVDNDTLHTYTFKHGGHALMDLPLALNPNGCARCEPRFATHTRRGLHAIAKTPLSPAKTKGGSRTARAHATTSSSGTEYEALLALACEETTPNDAPPAATFTAYRKMKTEWRRNVYLARSTIQGLGLFAKRDVDMSSMIIEYIGEVIRNEVTEVREKMYEKQNRGVYMFRCDVDRVVDATMAGGPARYMNHSCDPNCITELLTLVNGDVKIIVMAARPISAGEEFTYDYQFDYEDEETKLPCLCGAPNCHKWMN